MRKLWVASLYIGGMGMAQILARRQHIAGEDIVGTKRAVTSSGAGDKETLDINSRGEFSTSRFTITTDTSGAHATLDFIDLVEVTNFFDRDGGFGKLTGIQMLCKNYVSSNFIVHVFSEAPTIASAANATYSVSDSENEKNIGSFIVSRGSRFDAAQNFVFSRRWIDMDVWNSDSTDQQSLWLAFVAASSVTYTTTSGLSFILTGERR